MTPAEQNRAVAEIAGYEILPTYEGVEVIDRTAGIKYGIGDYYERPWDPRNNPAQAIEALDRVFDRWECAKDDLASELEYRFFMKGFAKSHTIASAVGPTFCAAAVAAILAAGGKS